MGVLLKNYNDLITSYYGNREYWLNGVLIKDFHCGIDIGGNLDYIKAFADGTVVEVVNNVSGYVDGGSYGNYVVIEHDNGFRTRYAHLKQNSITVKKGDRVSKGQIIAYMGATGTVTAAHLHFEVILNGNTVDPMPFYNGTKNFTIITENVERDETKDQLQVNKIDLRVRKAPATNQTILGFAKENGVYNYYETKEAGGYTWYKIAENQWLANSADWCTIYPKKDDKDTIKELQKQVEELKNKNQLLEQEITKLKESDNKYNIFTATKNTMYHINMVKGETLKYEKG